MVNSKHQLSFDKIKVIDDSSIQLNCGKIFSTGNIKWLVSSVPKQQLLLSKAFDSIRKQSYVEFMDNLMEIDAWNEKVEIETDSSDNGDVNNLCQLIDLSTEEDFDFVLCSDAHSQHDNENYNFNISAPERSFYYTETDQNNHFSLLHVAVDYSCLNIVKCLLDRMASVSKF